MQIKTLKSGEIMPLPENYNEKFLKLKLKL